MSAVPGAYFLSNQLSVTNGTIRIGSTLPELWPENKLGEEPHALAATKAACESLTRG